ncbi:hypothetical protein TSAR_008625 [Trichomalopsis sarcophagae]|nr:hypothetical protein TSAR_008625 [Trichomalopsis sarcophagae]
MIELREP